jgi:hypothetical protein
LNSSMISAMVLAVDRQPILFASLLRSKNSRRSPDRRKTLASPHRLSASWPSTLAPPTSPHRSAFKSVSIASVYSNPMIFWRRTPWRSQSIVVGKPSMPPNPSCEKVGRAAAGMPAAVPGIKPRVAKTELYETSAPPGNSGGAVSGAGPWARAVADQHHDKINNRGHTVRPQLRALRILIIVLPAKNDRAETHVVLSTS